MPGFGVPLWMYLLALALVSAAFYFRPSARAHRRVLALEREALALIPGPRREAAEILERHLEALGEKYPQYNRIWRLRKFIQDSRHAVR